jgi:N-acetylglucosamine-6-phosphate deacetylase
MDGDLAFGAQFSHERAAAAQAQCRAVIMLTDGGRAAGVWMEGPWLLDERPNRSR